MARGNTSVWLRFSTMGLQLGLSIYLGSLLGEYLDQKYPSESISYHKVITLFVVFGSTFSVIRQVIKLSKDEEKKEK